MQSAAEGGSWNRALAAAVHLYTASGAICGFMALSAAFRQDYAGCFTMLAIALLIDASDGTLARWAKVKQTLPWMDGDLLDNIVDYLTYVVAPVAVFTQPGILPDGTQAAALMILPASAYGFSRTDAKGFVEHYFQGFPSYWNVMAFYFVVLNSDPQTNLVILLTAVALVFVPMRWLYPTRSEVLRNSTLALGVVWAAICLVMVARLPEPSPMLATISLFYPIYYTAGSIFFHFRR